MTELISTGYTVDESVNAVKNTGVVDAATAIKYIENLCECEDNLPCRDLQSSGEVKIDWYATCVFTFQYIFMEC